MRVVSANDWLPLAAIAALFVAFSVWCVFGSVPSAVTGRGVLLRPRRVVGVQALGGGRLVSLAVHIGDQVQVGQVIARVDQSELRRKIEDDQQFLSTLLLQEHAKTSTQNLQVSLQRQQDQLEKKSLESQRVGLQQGLKDAAALDPLLERREEELGENRRLWKMEAIPFVISMGQKGAKNAKRQFSVKFVFQ